jgi:SAM-dependent methyltransferase
MSSDVAILSCPACLSAKTRTVATLAKGKYRVRAYQECRLEFVSPFIPGNGPLSSITAPSYLDAMKSQYETLKELIYRRAENRLKFYTGILGRKPCRFLEIGCGPGWMVKALCDLGHDAAGLEMDPYLVASAAALGANVRKGDICHLDQEPAPVCDVVVSSQTLEHIFSPLVALKNMAKMLRPGGLLHVDVPNGDGWGARWRRIRSGEDYWGAIALPHHQVCYHPRSLERLFALSGLQAAAILQKPTNHAVFGQVILPESAFSRLAIVGSKILGHGYLLIGIGRKPEHSKECSHALPASI